MSGEDIPADSAVGLYIAEIEAYDRAAGEWQRKAKKYLKRYKDEREETDDGRRRLNVFWSNVETLKPFLFSSTPKPVVRRRYEQDDRIALAASRVLQNALAYIVAESHFGSAVRNSRDDYLLAGRGTGWVRYVPPPGDDIAEESVSCDWVHWGDFGHNVARVWEEVGLVWRWVYLNREQLIARFGDDKGKEVALDWGTKSTADGDERAVAQSRARVCELWDKSKRKAFWFTKATPEFLDERDDPLKLDEFFPCPRPIYATLTTDSLIPVPDYSEYKDQAEQMDELTVRIAALTTAIRVTGVYNADVPELKRLLSEGTENTLIPVDAFAAFAEKGGLQGSIELLPIKDVAETLLALHEERDKVKADLYEITGMADIIRGSSNPEETATAQGIKAKFATLRLDERQREVERYVRNLIAIAGDIVCQKFDPETLKRMSGVNLPDVAPVPLPQPPMMGDNGGPPLDPLPPLPPPDWTNVTALLRDKSARRFKIDVEIGSTVAGDDQAEQQARMEFLKAAGGFLQQAMEVVQQMPQAGPLVGQMLMFGVRGFPVAAELEDAFEKFVEAANAMAKNPPPPKPDPAMAKVQADIQAEQAKQQADQQAAQVKMQNDQAHAAAELQSREDLARFTAQLEQQTEQARIAAKAEADERTRQMQADTEIRKARMDNDTKIIVARIAAGTQQATAMVGHAVTAAGQESAPDAEGKRPGDTPITDAITDAVRDFVEGDA